MRISYYILISFVLIVCCSFSERPGKESDYQTTKYFFGDSIIGVITLKSSFNTKDTITILNLDGSSWHKFSFTYDDSDGVYDFYNESFRPLSFNPDTYTLALTAISKAGNKFEIIANEETRLKKFIIVDGKNSLVYETFADFLKKAFAISFDERTNSLRKTINGEKLILKKSNNYLVRPLEIKNEWLKVRYEDQENNVKTEGWIKWRDNKKVIIQVHSD